MLPKIHEHIVAELQQNTRTDTIFVVTAIVFNLVILGVNSSIASEASHEYANSINDVILIVFIIMSLLVNGIAVTALVFGRRSRETLLNGLLLMYQDHDVAKYYDSSLIKGYGSRYLLFTGVILCLAVTGIVVPLLIRFG